MSSDGDYKSALDRLNLYHPRPQSQEPAGAGGPKDRKTLTLPLEYFSRTGHSVHELDQLNAVHVAGTKGKGSVCAMVESVLREYNLKTGLVTSPHLIEVRERIRINGVCLTREQFASYFWDCFNRLFTSKRNERNMPNYYSFFTFLAFHVFLEEKVDVAVVEVGRGGAYDCTNIIPNPVVCGITLLDLDHIAQLGPTLQHIAWHKTGICKPGHPLVLHPQLPEAMAVIEDRAKELNACSVEVAPSLRGYPGEAIVCGIKGAHNEANVSLAAQLCKKWLLLRGLLTEENSSTVNGKAEHHCGVPVANSFVLPQQFREGLRDCKWPGRTHVERRSSVTVYLDAAHTPLSIKACREWFQTAAVTEEAELRTRGAPNVLKVLLFNFLGDRDASCLLEPLVTCGFDYAIFSPSYTGADSSNTPDQVYRKSTPAQELTKSEANEEKWRTLVEAAGVSTKSKLFPSLDHALEWVCRGRGIEIKSTCPQLLGRVEATPSDLLTAGHVQVLVTGSVRLVGTTMFTLGCSI